MNNKELLDAFRAQQAVINTAINELQFFRRAEVDMIASAKTRRIAIMKTLASDAGVDASAWTGVTEE